MQVRAQRLLPSAVPWISEDRLLLGGCACSGISTHSVFECAREVVAEFVDGGVDGGFSVVVLQVLVYGLD